MTRVLLAAQSGWGKSWHTQAWIENNIDNVDTVVVMDYADEYRGLAKAGLAKWAGVGEIEASFSTDEWRAILDDQPRLVLARKVLPEDWRDVVAKISRVLNDMPGTGLIVVDEAHFVAPQAEAYPKAIKEVATTGRGEGIASLWVTQRTAEIDKTPVAQADVRILGGFTEENDIYKFRGQVGYNADVHNPQNRTVSVPDAIDRGGNPVQKFKDGDDVVGSEWIKSTSDGDMERIDTREISMRSTHYGSQGVTLEAPA